MRREGFPLTGDAALVSEITGLPEATIRRLRKLNDFPQPFRLSVRSRPHWVIPEVVNWLEGRAGRPLRAA